MGKFDHSTHGRQMAKRQSLRESRGKCREDNPEGHIMRINPVVQMVCRSSLRTRFTTRNPRRGIVSVVVKEMTSAIWNGCETPARTTKPNWELIYSRRNWSEGPLPTTTAGKWPGLSFVFHLPSGLLTWKFPIGTFQISVYRFTAPATPKGRCYGS